MHDRVIFTLLVVAAHSTTFLYQLMISVVERWGLFQDRKLGVKRPRMKNSPALMRQVWIKNIRSHMFLIPGVAYFLLYDVAKSFGMQVAHSAWLTTTWLTVGRDLVVSLAVNDTGFYWGHRLLHAVPWLYQAVHKQHHDFKHPVAEASEWAHPLEDILCNIVPTAAGPMIMGSHAYVLAIWLILRLWKALDAHSGYMLPFPLSMWHQWPGALSAELHDYHHEINQGCYGASSLFWDRLCGTDAAYNAMKTKAAAAADTPAASSPATRSRISRKKY